MYYYYFVYETGLNGISVRVVLTTVMAERYVKRERVSEREGGGVSQWLVVREKLEGKMNFK